MRRASTWGRAMAVAGVAVLLISGCGPVRRIADSPSEFTDQELLGAVSLSARDVASGSFLEPYEGGDEVIGQVSLDLCYGDFPSEALRSGRNQVGIRDEAGVAWVSSEAILYPTREDAEQAMGELEAARDDCPTDPVGSPSGDDLLTWSFTDDPDGQWPVKPGINRHAYEFTITESLGQSWTGTATYLQRGRMILALYASPPDGPARTLRNAPDQARFVEVMSNRLAELPAEPLEYGEALQDSNTLIV